MPETGGANIEVAHHLHEEKMQESVHAVSGVHQVLEAVEVTILAVVAIATAWSGYQAARWDSVQATLYGRSSRLRVEGQALDLQANQERIYDAGTVVEWLKSQAHGETKLAELFERRLLPEFRPAFEAWKRTDPVHNPNAPAGPMLMPEYHSTRADEAAQKNQEASQLFDQGTRARDNADDYVRLTVVLASVLFLAAMSPKFHSHWVRVALVAIALLMLCIPLWRLLTLPRA
jgi:hypothetical protein